MDSFLETAFLFCCLAFLFLSAVGSACFVAAMIAAAFGLPVIAFGALGAIVGGLTIVILATN